jgi:teichuronic acid biosynthesis glycosyltransferase TuaG
VHSIISAELITRHCAHLTHNPPLLNEEFLIMTNTASLDALQKNTPSFSIVMPAYNASTTIAQSILSVQHQSFSSWELVVVNDVSTDSTADVVNKLAKLDARIVFINLPSNQGAAGARNAALRMARGKYISFLDSDDFWLPEKLSLQFELLESGVPVVFSAYWRHLQTGKYSLVSAKPFIKADDFHSGNPIGNLTGAYLASAVGIVEQEKHGHEDIIMWHEIVRRAGYAKGIEKALCIYSVIPGSLSSKKTKAASWQWKILRQKFSLGFFKASMGFARYAMTRIAFRFMEKFQSIHRPDLDEITNVNRQQTNA